MARETLELTARQYKRISWLALELGCTAITGTDGHRVIGTHKQMNNLHAVVSDVSRTIPAYKRIAEKLERGY